MLLVHIISFLYIISGFEKSRSKGARYRERWSSPSDWSDSDSSSDSTNDEVIGEIELDGDDYHYPAPAPKFKAVSPHLQKPSRFLNDKVMSSSNPTRQHTGTIGVYKAFNSLQPTNSMSDNDLNLEKAKGMLANILAEAKRRNNDKSRTGLPCLANSPDTIYAPPPPYWGQNKADTFGADSGMYNGYRHQYLPHMVAPDQIYGEVENNLNQVAAPPPHKPYCPFHGMQTATRTRSSSTTEHRQSCTFIRSQVPKVTSKPDFAITTSLYNSRGPVSIKRHNATVSCGGAMQKIGKACRWFHKLAKDLLFR